MKTLLKTTMLAALLATAAPGFSQAAALKIPSGEYVLEKTHASLTWQVKHLGLSNYTARFVGFDATVGLDPADITKSTVNVSIDPRSVRTDFPFPEKEDFDKVIAEKFLKAGEHPAITFQSTGITATGPNTGKLNGNLTFLGVTKPVTLDATLNGAMDHPMRKVPMLGVSATGSFKRSDFGSKELLPFVGDDITLIIEAEFEKKP